MQNLKRYTNKRCLHWLVDSLPENKVESPVLHTLPSVKHANVPKSVQKLIITPNELTDHFRYNKQLKPDGTLLSKSQKLFNRAKATLEWSLTNYDEIHDVKEDAKAKRDPTYKPKYTMLPEILFLGHTNAGKSSLINTLMLSADEGKTTGASTEYAYVSSRAGYTKTVNCFNISNKFRLVDSPGFGQFGKKEQGEIVIDYIQKRKVLRRTFLLIDSVEGFREEDLNILEFLIDEGAPFEIVFTKTDMVIAKYLKSKKVSTLKHSELNKRQANVSKVNEANDLIIKYFEKMIEEAGVLQAKLLPTLIFSNTIASKYTNGRYGYKEIRAIILQSCGL